MERVNNTQAENNYGRQSFGNYRRADNRYQNIENPDKKSMSALEWAGIIGLGAAVAGGAATLIKHHGLPDIFKPKGIPVLEQFLNDAGEKISKVDDKEFTFARGRAILEDGKGFSGKFKSGNAVLTYKNGYLQKSVIEGEENLTKYYNQDGQLLYAQGNRLKPLANGTKVLRRTSIQHKLNKNGDLTAVIQDGKKQATFDYKNSELVKATVNGNKIEIAKAQAPELEQVFVDAEGKITNVAGEGTEKFNRAGKSLFKFINNRAVLEDGSGYTGMFKTSNGTFLTYKNGYLQSAEKQDENGYRKAYGSKGQFLSSITTEEDARGKLKKSVTVHKYDKNGNLTVIRRDGKKAATFKYKDDELTKAHVDGEKVYDKKAEEKAAARAERSAQEDFEDPIDELERDIQGAGVQENFPPEDLARDDSASYSAAAAVGNGAENTERYAVHWHLPVYSSSEIMPDKGHISDIMLGNEELAQKVAALNYFDRENLKALTDTGVIQKLLTEDPKCYSLETIVRAINTDLAPGSLQRLAQKGLLYESMDKLMNANEGELLHVLNAICKLC